MNSADAPVPKPVGGLRERAITAAVLAPVGIAGVMLLPQPWFARQQGHQAFTVWPLDRMSAKLSRVVSAGRFEYGRQDVGDMAGRVQHTLRA